LTVYEALPGRLLWDSPDRGTALLDSGGRRLVTAGPAVVVRDARTLRRLKRIPARGDPLVLDRGGGRLAIATPRGTSVVDLRTGRSTRLRERGAATRSRSEATGPAAFSPDGRRLVGLVSATRVGVWDVLSGRRLAMLSS